MSVDTHERVEQAARGLDPRPWLLWLIGAVTATAGRAWVRFGTILGFLVLAGFVASVMAIGWLRPVHSWDMIAYLASALQGGFESAQALHSHAWETMRLGTSPGHFLALSEGDTYRLRQFADPDAFQSMLGMYEVKWLYVKLLGLLIPLTGEMNAGYAINIASAALFTGVLSWWLLRVGMLNLAPLVVALLMVAGFPQMAMAETPDLLCTTLIMSSILLLDRDKVLAGGAALVLGVAVRPDMAAFAGVLMAVAWVWSDRRTTPLALAFAASIAVYVGASASAHHPGWWAHLYFSTYQMQETLEFFDPPFSPAVYATGFAWNLIRSAFENSWLGIYVVLLGGWAMMYAGGLRFARERHVLIAATLAATAAKFVVFPMHDGRVYMPLILAAALLLLVETRDAARRRTGAGSGAATGG